MAAFSKSIKDKIACVLHDEMEIHTMNDIVEYCNEYLPREHKYSICIVEYHQGLYLNGELCGIPRWVIYTSPTLLPITDSDIAQLEIILKQERRHSYNLDSDICVSILRTTATRHHRTMLVNVSDAAISFDVSINDTDELIYVRRNNGDVPRYKYLYTSVRKRTIA